MSPLFVLLLAVAVQSDGRPTSDTAPALVLVDSQDVYLLDAYLRVLVDSSRRWEIYDVANPSFSTHFRPVDRLDLGYSSAAYWLRVRISDRSMQRRPWILEVAEKSLDHVEIHTFPASADYPVITGDGYPFGTRPMPHRTFAFQLPVEERSERQVYLRIASSGPISFPLRIWSTNAFLAKDREGQLFLGVFFGMLLIMGVYNLVLFGAIRHVSYLLYALFIFSFLGYQLSVERIAFEYVWPENVWWMERANSTLALACAALGFLFTRSFLATAQYAPRLDRVLTAAVILCAPMMLFAMFGPRDVANETVVYFFVLSVPILVASALVCFRRGDRAAGYYLAGWLFLLGGVLVGMFGFLGLVPRDPFGMRSVQIGAALGITTLSQIGLGYRYDQLRKARESLRRRIATDLHDEIGSGLTQISLYSELVGRATDGRAAGLAGETGELARTLAGKMQDIVWAVHPGREGFDGLELRIKDFATRLLGPREIAFDMDGRVPHPRLPLPVELRQNLLLISKEIIHNAVRHSECTRITVQYGSVRDVFWFRICDDGRGFDPGTVQKNNGLRNLQYRADQIGATISLETQPGGPTCYHIKAPRFARTTRFGSADLV